MSSDFPARRELPPEVRDRIRVRFRAGLDRPERRGRATWFAAAAAVVLLAGGAVFGIGALRGSTPVSPAAGDAPLDRCWTAAEKAGKTEGLGSRAQWVTTATESSGDDVVVAFTVDGKPAFCETTATTVTLSDPAAQAARPGGQAAGVLLFTATGMVAGVADPSWEQVELSMPDGLGMVVAKPDKQTGQFIGFTGADPAKTALWLGRAKQGQSTRLWPRGPVPRIADPLVSVVDRPGDRSSAEGRALGECLAKVPDPPALADGYQPGAMLTDGPNSLVLARMPGHLIACVREGTSYRLVQDTFLGLTIPVRRLSVPPIGGKVPFVGLTPPSAKTMSAEFFLDGTQTTAVPVVRGTFAYWVPPNAVPQDNGEVSVQTSDARGVGLFSGGIPLR